MRSRSEWRRWLEAHHETVADVWLVFHKQHTDIARLSYDEAVEEAVCFGWVDSLIRRIDDERYGRKFTPRNPDSRWSTAKRRRPAVLRAARASHRRQFVAWIDAAKREETKRKRLTEAIRLLAAGRKLGLK